MDRRLVTWVAAALVAAGGARALEPAQDRPAAARPAAEERAAPRIDINSATAGQLKTLPGIGDREARKIIAGRPWSTKYDLVVKGVLPEGRYVALRHRIVVLAPAFPPGTKK